MMAGDRVTIAADPPSVGTSEQTRSAMRQRGWKRQPDGGSIGLGGSPASGASSVRLSGSIDGMSEQRARVGVRGAANSASAGPISAT